jgi:hypothetical protein
MTETIQGKCAYPGCENQPRPDEDGAGARPRYCGLPDPVSGKPHTALTSFRRRQELARQGGDAAAEPDDLGRPGVAIWHLPRQRRADRQRLQQAGADAEEARSAMLEADAQLTEALAARAAAEQAAVAAHAQVAEAERAAEERVRAAKQERDHAVTGARRRAEEAESRARTGEREAARARQAAESASAELRQARDTAERQAAQIRENATREQAELQAAFEAKVAAAEDANASLRARAERAEAELERARAERDSAAGQATPGRPGGATRGRRRSGGSR